MNLKLLSEEIYDLLLIYIVQVINLLSADDAEFTNLLIY
jgi:hypothetical protein